MRIKFRLSKFQRKMESKQVEDKLLVVTSAHKSKNKKAKKGVKQDLQPIHTNKSPSGGSPVIEGALYGLSEDIHHGLFGSHGGKSV
jgi:hypothetical protein